MKGNAKDYLSTAQQFFTAYDAHEVDGMLGLCPDGALGRYAPYGRESVVPIRGGVIHSVKFLSTNASKIIAATKAAKVPRLLVVGGAGSLEVSPGLTLVNTPDFPPEYKPETLAGVEFLNVLRGEKELDWTFLSPSYFFAPGERTGKFRLGKDELLVAADGQSRICTEDFAIALVDELEQPKHSRQRFTVGY